MKIRLLATLSSGAAPGRLRISWGWTSTSNAEYGALTQLQAHAFVTLDVKLARGVKGIVNTATIDSLR
jgi:hypothetical protein